ncbi:MAG TPA: FAD-dependent monooxygenase [Steroidobacteraceae bacterium]|nr:FAD-dependent monooxygenase [Steroidobacteraceae bacterium]
MADTSVLVVGGSLNGLTTAALLAQHGVPCTVVERHASTTVQYKFRGISPRSMEVYRSLGIEDDIRAHRTGDQKSGEIARAPNLASSSDLHFQGRPWADASDLSAVTAETCDQDQLEPILRRYAQRLGADLRFGHELVDLEQNEDEVIASIREVGGSQTQVLRASYVVAADGVAGRTRERVGIGRHGPGVLQHWMNLIFEADLQPYLQGKRFTSCFVTDINASVLPREDRWLLALQFAPDRGEKPEDFEQARTEQLVRHAAGRNDLRVKLYDARPWEVAAYVADRFRAGRVFIVGDAAHSMPPTGGFGGNTGIHDAHNLAWKLALVTSGRAPPALLDTYDAERRPIAEDTLAQALARLGAWFKNLGERLPPPVPIVDDFAVIFGQRYPAGPFVAEGQGTLFEDPRAPLRPPGSRAPHVVIARADGPVAVHDLVGKRFLLLAGSGGQAWERAAATVAPELRIDLHAVRVEPTDSSAQSRLREAYGVDEQGAVLIRPDGIIGWRSASGTADATGALRAAVERVLCR